MRSRWGTTGSAAAARSPSPLLPTWRSGRPLVVRHSARVEIDDIARLEMMEDLRQFDSTALVATPRRAAPGGSAPRGAVGRAHRRQAGHRAAAQPAPRSRHLGRRDRGLRRRATAGHVDDRVVRLAAVRATRRADGRNRGRRRAREAQDRGRPGVARSLSLERAADATNVGRDRRGAAVDRAVDRARRHLSRSCDGRRRRTRSFDGARHGRSFARAIPRLFRRCSL